MLEEEDIGMREKNKMLQNKYIVLLLITGAVYFFLRFISPLLTPVIIAGNIRVSIRPPPCRNTESDSSRECRIRPRQATARGLLCF